LKKITNRKEVRLQQPERKVIISGGGTGGHIFPAIAIANSLRKADPSIEILFVGAKGKMEMEKVPAAGYRIEGLWISGIQRKLTLDNLSFPLKLVSSILKSRRIIRSFKPDVVVGVGGFASGPLLFAAAQMKIPTLIQEQNSYPGITNRLLAKRVNRICVAYEGMQRFFPREKIILTGNPVRQDVVNLEGKRARGLEEFNLSAGQGILLVVGGSQGALSINRCIKDGLGRLTGSGIQVIWQTGKSFYQEASDFVRSQGYASVRVLDFISRMDLAYAVSDVVVSRAGASAVSELSLVRKPCILVPYPFAAEDHQTKNAVALVNHKAALLIQDSEAGRHLVNNVLYLFSNEDKRNELRENISRLGITNSADVIANEVLGLIR
jgi:UDP-N-acetylglucosamine--N-acetylmuramyl-(pentapeptide) pyrophosphoryl-undecaprenol N-acetylglucosamine transferase